jgi:hypothetical protein
MWKNVGDSLNGYEGPIVIQHKNGEFLMGHSNWVDVDSEWSSPHNGKKQNGVELSKSNGYVKWMELNPDQQPYAYRYRYVVKSSGNATGWNVTNSEKTIKILFDEQIQNADPNNGSRLEIEPLFL